jgi:hypothetical protein
VSIMTKKNRVRVSGDRAKQRARDTASQVVPTAKNAVPIAKNAGQAAKQTAEDAVAWAAPRVKDARTWAAPHVEQAGLAVRDKIAPAISEKIAPAVSSALVEAARRLDDTPAKRRRWPRVLAGVAMLAAAGSAVAAILMRRRPDFAAFGSEGYSAAPAPGAEDGSAATPAAYASTPVTEDEAAVNGRARTS